MRSVVSMDEQRIASVVAGNLHVRDVVVMWADAGCRLGEMRKACRKKGTSPARSVVVNAQAQKVQELQLAAYRQAEIAVTGSEPFAAKGDAAEKLRVVIARECDALVRHAVADPTDFLAATRHTASNRVVPPWDTPRAEGA